MIKKNIVLVSAWVSTAVVSIVSMIVGKNPDNAYVMLIPVFITLADKF